MVGLKQILRCLAFLFCCRSGFWGDWPIIWYQVFHVRYTITYDHAGRKQPGQGLAVSQELQLLLNALYCLLCTVFRNSRNSLNLHNTTRVNSQIKTFSNEIFFFFWKKKWWIFFPFKKRYLGNWHGSWSMFFLVLRWWLMNSFWRGEICTWHWYYKLLSSPKHSQVGKVVT